MFRARTITPACRLKKNIVSSDLWDGYWQSVYASLPAEIIAQLARTNTRLINTRLKQYQEKIIRKKRLHRNTILTLQQKKYRKR